MLVLSRHQNEEVVIDVRQLLEDYAAGKRVNPIIKITTVQLRGDRARLGFTADNSVNVVRTELIQSPLPTTASLRDAVHA